MRVAEKLTRDGRACESTSRRSQALLLSASAGGVEFEKSPATPALWRRGMWWRSSAPRRRRRRHQAGGADTKYSVASQHTVDTLEGLDMQLKNMQLDLDRSADAIGAPPGTGLDPKLRNDLAQLHGNLNKLLATKLDAILTGDLNSGRMTRERSARSSSEKCARAASPIDTPPLLASRHPAARVCRRRHSSTRRRSKSSYSTSESRARTLDTKSAANTRDTRIGIRGTHAAS